MSSREQQRISSDSLQIPGLVQSEDSVEQLAFGANPVTPLPANWQAGPQSASGLADLPDLPTTHQPVSQAGVADLPTAHQPVSQSGLTPQADSQPGSTRSLSTEVQPSGTKALANTTAQRPLLVIQGTNKAAGRLIRPPQGRRHVINIAALALLLVIIGGTLLVVSPLGHEVGLSSLVTGSSLMQNTNNLSLSLVAQATATAVHYQQTDGYDPGSSGVYVTGSPHPWPYGVCTYWANYRYHQVTGNWVTWTGNAYQWAEGAKLAGWNVSSTPHAPSIIVLAPGVQGASGYGHVAVVESVNGNSAYTSNMNWYANGGGYGRVSYYTFNAGAGVSFIWK